MAASQFDVLITHIRIIITKGISRSVVWIKPNRPTTVVIGTAYVLRDGEFVPYCFYIGIIPIPEVQSLVDELKALNYPS